MRRIRTFNYQNRILSTVNVPYLQVQYVRAGRITTLSLVIDYERRRLAAAIFYPWTSTLVRGVLITKSQPLFSAKFGGLLPCQSS
jgi:hypothetical protein